MQTYDIVMLVVLGGATFFGFLKGFAWQVASLASLVLSYMLALRFSDALAPQLNADPRWSKYLAMLIIYAGTSLFVWLAFRVVSGTIDRIKLREFDRQIGGLFGLLKGALFCIIITFFAVTLTESSRSAVLNSKSGGHIARLLNEAKPVMPPQLSEMLDPILKKLDKGLDPTQTVEHPNLQVPNNIPIAPPAAAQYLTQPNFVSPPSPPQYNPSQPAYPSYPAGSSQPAVYPPAFDYQSGQNYAPPTR